MADIIPQEQIPETPASEAPATETQEKKFRRRGILFVVVLVLALVAIALWWRSTYTESTDDASVSGHLIQVSARIAGQVATVKVDENQLVKKGDLIAELDSRDYQVAVENAEAVLASAQANAEAAQANVPITTVNTDTTLTSAGASVSGAEASVAQAQRQLEAAQARVKQAQANNLKAQSDRARYKPLVDRDVISKQQYDSAVAAADGAKAAVADAQANEEAASAGIQVARDRKAQSVAQLRNAGTGPQQVATQNARARQAVAQVQQAQAQLDQAQLNLSYTHILAPANGIITRKSVEINQNVAAGQNLLTLVSLDDLWVTANFKETQLRYMQAGQQVEIKADATGKTYHGKITQIGGATGSVLSLFPPENATGNYVKVVQRLPVRIDFTNLKDEDPNHALRPGLSVGPSVSVK